ncbi:terminal uridylyltransferase 4-like isoform X2 [Gigantopelta aegis]|uniref:terminal uridylyltransferase 4-like isoform X2 n=1 Tax=Gigantopelta aegis TaxID=1735272 RepID=UPI001B88D5DC|nr:terminal uridylyltransferase 4-like isoform X2 [Gigantopelta aegis]
MAEAQVNPDLARAEQTLKQLLNLDPDSQEKQKNRRRNRNRNRRQTDKEPNASFNQNDGAGGDIIPPAKLSKNSSGSDELKMTEERKRNRPRRTKKNNADGGKLYKQDIQLEGGEPSSPDAARGTSEFAPVSSKPKWSPNNAPGPPAPDQSKQKQKQNQKMSNPPGNSKPVKAKPQKHFQESSPKQRFYNYEKRMQNDQNNSSNPQDEVEKHLHESNGAQESGGQQQQANQASTKQKESEKLSKRMKNRQHAASAAGEEEKVENSILREMERQRVFPLKKKSLKFPRARFFCRLCDYHLDRVVDYQRHVSEARHMRRKEVTDSEVLLCNMPPPSPKQLAALDAAVEEIFLEHSLTEEDVQMRAQIVKEVETYIKKKLPDISLRIYGSSATGFGLKTSDINIDLFAPNASSVPKVLSDVFLLLKDSAGLLENVRSDFSAICPAILFNHPQTGVQCQISVNSNTAYHTGQLLALYSTLDPRLKKLAVVFRYWAKLCHLDNQQEGTLPAYATNLMTIFYLQHTSPQVLPVLSKELPDNPEETEQSCVYFEKIKQESDSWVCHNTQSVGELWLELLRYYSLTFDMANVVISIRKTSPVARSEKKWNSKKLAIEDPFATKRNIARTVSNSRIYEYFQDTLRKAYHYFGLPRKANGESLIPAAALLKMVEKATKEEMRKDEQVEAASADESGDEDCKKTTLDSKTIHTIDNKTSEKQSKSNETAEDTSEQLDPDTDSHKSRIPLIDEATKESDDGIINQSNDSAHSSSNVCEPVDDQTMSVTETISRLSVDDESSDKHHLWQFAKDFAETIIQNAVGELCEQNSTECVSDSEKDRSTVVMDTPSEVPSSEALDVSAISSMIKDEDCCYEFTEKNLTDGKGPAIICGYCEKEGHLKTACPDDMLPDLKPLPPPDKQFFKLLTNTLKQVPKDFGPSYHEVQERNQILQELQYFINYTLYEDAELCLFGSSCNGFGFVMSDLDICMTFHSKPSGKDLNYPHIVEQLAKVLKEHRGLYNILAIPTAKVPIVKFKHRRSGLEADISLYNTLAQHNTRLLEKYSLIDPRVKILGYAFKVFARVCDIGDASRGSLSSYAYILMLLHFLQQCDPPVVPVLQELYEGEVKPEKMIDGCNAWFYDDISKLPFVWSQCGKNSQSVGELWLDLFRYYTEEFNYKDQVVCIRQKGPLTRFEKLWNGKCIAIEDPFDIKHNLGAGLSRKMNNYIFKALIHGRQLYGTPVNLPTNELYVTVADYFFDRTLLSEGSPPNDRGCRVCGKIGHIAKECHIVVNRKEREERGRKAKAAQDQERRQDNSNRNNMNAGNQRNPVSSPQKGMYNHPLAGSPIKQTRSPGYRVNSGPFRPQMTPNKYTPQGKPQQNSSSPSAGFGPVPFLFDPPHRQVLLQPRAPQSAQLMRGMSPQQFPMQAPQGYPPHSNHTPNVGRSFQHQSQSTYNSYPAQTFSNINVQSMTRASNHQSMASGAPLYMLNSNIPSENSNSLASALTGSPVMEFHGHNGGRVESQSKQK